MAFFVFFTFFQVISCKQFRSDIPVFSGVDSLMDTWEPMITNDPSSDLIYIFATNSYGVRGCVTCGIDPILFKRTSTSGSSWETINNFTWEYLDRGEGTPATADPVVISDQQGNLYATYMRDWNISFSKSLNHGQTWTPPVIVSGDLKADKNWMSIDPNNSNLIYATFNSVLPYEVHSFDGGETWSVPHLLDEIDEVYFFACGSVVRSDGMTFIAYGAIADEDSTSPSYAIVYASSDQFQTFVKYEIDYWTGLQSCPEWALCEPDFLNGGCSLGIDSADNVYYVYNAYPNHGVNPTQQGVFLSSFSKDSMNFSIPILVSDLPNTSNEVSYVGFPMIAGGLQSGDVRLAWMDNRTGMWNLWYRSSTNGFNSSQGSDNSAAASIRLSTYNKLTSFENSEGFEFPYGDYGMILVDQKGYTHVVWGEGLGRYAGGTVMYTNEVPYSNDDNDGDGGSDKSDSLSDTSVVIVSVIFSYVIGSIITGFGVWFWYTKRASEKKSLISSSMKIERVE